MQFSVLDIQAPVDLPEVVAVAEQAGYHRYWASEHYTPMQTASPHAGHFPYRRNFESAAYRHGRSANTAARTNACSRRHHTVAHVLSWPDRDNFRANAVTPAPYFAITAFGAVGGCGSEALRRWHAHSAIYCGSESQTGSSFSGTATVAAAQVTGLIEGYRPDETLLDCFAGNLEACLDGLRQLGTPLGVAQRPALSASCRGRAPC